MNNRFIIYFVTCLFLGLFSCKSDPKVDNSANSIIVEKDTNTNNLNVSILLDLSDRINPNKYPNESMEFYERDVAYIKIIAETFHTHLMNKRVRTINDKIRVFFDPEPKNPEINKISKALNFKFNRNNATLDFLETIKSEYSNQPLEIYQSAINDNDYIGSDVWKFFQSKVEDFCIQDGYRNILVILTDGYIYHENSKRKSGNLTTYITPQVIRQFGFNDVKWKDKFENGNFGFISANKNLNDLEVLVLGLNPDSKNPYEEDVLRFYWTDWLSTMGVDRFDIKNAELPANMEKPIQDFILKME